MCSSVRRIICAGQRLGCLLERVGAMASTWRQTSGTMEDSSGSGTTSKCIGLRDARDRTNHVEPVASPAWPEGSGTISKMKKKSNKALRELTVIAGCCCRGLPTGLLNVVKIRVGLRNP
eukprot:scaffold1842_cov33-Prasinocladus_malaysianus.AAC.1